MIDFATEIPAPARPVKVPEVTMLFWLIKMMSTTVGKSAADLLNADPRSGLTGYCMVLGILLMAILPAQVRSRQFTPWLYWCCMLLVGMAGALLSDSLIDQLSVPLTYATGLFCVMLWITLAVWHAEESSVSFRSIVTRKRELFYWLAILFTFALGTIAGDWVAENLHPGYAFTVLLLGVALGLVAVGHYLLEFSATSCFWAACVLTCSFGNACSDWLAQPVHDGGLGLGKLVTSGLFLLTTIGLVGYLSATRKHLTGSQWLE